MRVLVTTESFLPYLSGVTVSVDALARGLRGRGHDVLVLAPRPDAGSTVMPVGSPGPAPAFAWLPSYELPSIVPPGYRMPLPAPGTAAVRRALAFRPDVVHANSPFVTGLLARRIARRVGAPLVFTHHTRFGEYAHYLGPLAAVARAATEAALRRFWLGCDAILAPSSDLAAEIGARLPADERDRVHVAPTGVDVAGIRALDPVDPRRSAGWSHDTVVVAALGRLAPEKRPELLADAFAAARAMAPELRLLVIGGGPSEEGLRATVAGDLARSVAFTGRVDRLEALRMLRGSDLFLFVSQTETQGLVLAEALAAGLPAVAAEGPGVRDSVRDGLDGVVVADAPRRELVRQLAAALAGLAPAERRRPLAARAAADADRFSIERRVTAVEALYRMLLTA